MGFWKLVSGASWPSGPHVSCGTRGTGALIKNGIPRCGGGGGEESPGNHSTATPGLMHRRGNAREPASQPGSPPVDCCVFVFSATVLPWTICPHVASSLRRLLIKARVSCREAPYGPCSIYRLIYYVGRPAHCIGTAAAVAAAAAAANLLLLFLLICCWPFF